MACLWSVQALIADLQPPTAISPATRRLGSRTSTRLRAVSITRGTSTSTSPSPTSTWPTLVGSMPRGRSSIFADQRRGTLRSSTITCGAWPAYILPVRSPPGHASSRPDRPRPGSGTPGFCPSAQIRRAHAAQDHRVVRTGVRRQRAGQRRVLRNSAHLFHAHVGDLGEDFLHSHRRISAEQASAKVWSGSSSLEDRFGARRHRPPLTSPVRQLDGHNSGVPIHRLALLRPLITQPRTAAVDASSGHDQASASPSSTTFSQSSIASLPTTCDADLAPFLDHHAVKLPNIDARQVSGRWSRRHPCGCLPRRAATVRAGRETTMSMASPVSLGCLLLMAASGRRVPSAPSCAELLLQHLRPP